jgi:hypothetical protein
MTAYTLDHGPRRLRSWRLVQWLLYFTWLQWGLIWGHRKPTVSDLYFTIIWIGPVLYVLLAKPRVVFLVWETKRFADYMVRHSSVGGPKIERGPRTRELQRKVRNSRKTGRQGISKSLYSPQKLWTPFTCAHAPLFIGRCRDFYIPKIPSNLRNIPNVNTYRNVSVIYEANFKYLQACHYFAPQTRTFWGDVCDLAPSWFPNLFFHEDYRLLWLLNQIFTKSPNSTDSCF